MEYLTRTFPMFNTKTGKRIPKTVSKEIECVRLRVGGGLLQRAIEIDQAKTMSYYENRTEYGKGFVNKGILTSGLIGHLGEAAGAIYFGLITDWSYKRRGDGGFDFVVGGKKTDIKAAKDTSNYRNYIVRTERRREKKLDSIVYIGSYLEKPATIETEGYCDIVLIGYTTKRYLEQQPILPSPVRNSKHWNTEMYWCTLTPIRNLLHFHERHLAKLKEEEEETVCS